MTSYKDLSDQATLMRSLFEKIFTFNTTITRLQATPQGIHICAKTSETIKLLLKSRDISSIPIIEELRKINDQRDPRYLMEIVLGLQVDLIKKTKRCFDHYPKYSLNDFDTIEILGELAQLQKGQDIPLIDHLKSYGEKNELTYSVLTDVEEEDLIKCYHSGRHKRFL